MDHREQQPPRTWEPASESIKPTIAVSYVRRLYESPAPELDLGTFRQSGVILLRNDLGKFHYDANFIVTEQTQSGVRGHNSRNRYPSHTRRNLEIDAGFDHGLTKTSTQWEEFAGFSYLLPHRLWKK